MSRLQEYQKKRDFSKTSEPAVEPPARRARERAKASTQLRFVVQKHAARRLHYDFRLELDGVLLSWAVPKGPSLDPATKRLAMQTEDHPLAYVDFEGTIPKGQYGGGTVLVWDRGFWKCEGDPREAYERGHLKFALYGDKLKGSWHLVRRGTSKGWLLFKSRDQYAVSGPGASSLVDDAPNSVLSGRGLEEIARSETPAPRSERVDLPIALTHPDRILYPEQGLTKQALAEYYLEVAEHMLPHVKDRVLMLVRCPEGRAKECFYQKHMTKGMPEPFKSVAIREKGKLVQSISLTDVRGLVALAQIGALEVHAWGARADRPERPDRLVFDLDPGSGVPWADVVEAARRVERELEELQLRSFVKTTGGKGLHVVVPIQRRIDWETAKNFSRAVAERVCHAEPDRYVCSMSKAKRSGRIFIDYLRNARGATSVCAYSPRARSGAPVSTPLAWDELDGTRADAYTVQNLRERLAQLSEDPWHEMARVQQSITQSMLRRLRVD